VKPSRRRTVVGYLCGAYRVSERHASEVVLLPRATHRYQSIRAPLTALRLRMRELVQTRIRYGYRKIRVLLIRQGCQMCKKLVYRLNNEEGLGLRRRRKSRRTVSEYSRQKRRAERPNHVWGFDFVADQLIDGRRFRALTVNAWPSKSARAER
jgi:putative transposase